MSGKRITDLERVKSVSGENAYLVETESGDRHIQHKDLVASIEKDLPIGDMEELKELENLEDQEEPSVKEKFTLAKAILKVLGIATTVFKGTDGVKDGTAGLVPAPTAKNKNEFLRSDGTWAKIDGSGGGDVNAENVKFADGKTAEEKLGMIDGATDDLNCENDRMVAKMVAVKQLNDSLNFPDGTHFYPDIQDGKPGYNTDPERGADTFYPFSSGQSMSILYNGKPPITLTFEKNYSNIIIASGVYEGSFTTKTLNDIPFDMDETIQAGGPYGMSCKILKDIKKNDVLKLVGGGLTTVIYG